MLKRILKELFLDPENIGGWFLLPIVAIVLALTSTLFGG